MKVIKVKKNWEEFFYGRKTIFFRAKNLSVNTGIPPLVRFFGPQGTALFEKPH